MLHQTDFRGRILLEPIRQGADSLKIISGYATHTMASWHITEIMSQALPAIDITLIVGMCPFDGISRSVHEGFKNLIARNNTSGQSNLICQYVVEGAPVHSKLYLWEKKGKPLSAYTGSANYTQSAFSRSRRELLHECAPSEAIAYYNTIEPDTMFCTHAEIEDHVTLMQAHPVLSAEESPIVSLRGSGIRRVTLSLLAGNGNTGTRSGLNWGQRDGREPNQAYIPLPIETARMNFFPIAGNSSGKDNPHFSVLTDDGKQLILRVEQQNNKAITTPLNNSLIGEYFRRRIGLANGAYVTRQDLEHYGRTSVTFYKLDDEQYVMDFSV